MEWTIVSDSESYQVVCIGAWSRVPASEDNPSYIFEFSNADFQG